jgi:hypothetical protein
MVTSGEGTLTNLVLLEEQDREKDLIISTSVCLSYLLFHG